MDQQLTCRCGEQFTFTEGEQQFYSAKGLTPPKRCPKCRAEKRKQREAEQQQQGNGKDWDLKQ